MFVCDEEDMGEICKFSSTSYYYCHLFQFKSNQSHFVNHTWIHMLCETDADPVT